MKGWVIARTTKTGEKRYDAAYRIGTTIRTKTFVRKKAADEFLVATMNTLIDGTYREITPVTFSGYVERWLDGLADLKPSTRRAYGSMVRSQLAPSFGDLPLQAITVEAVNAWLRSRAETLRRKTLQNHLGLLHKILEDAREAGHLAQNRLSRSRALRRPRVIRADDEQEIEILTPTEIGRLLDAVEPEWYPLFFTAVCTGVRLGELLALQWGDLDEAGHRLHVRRSAYAGVFYVPKTKRSRRAVDLGDQLLAVLTGLRRERYGTTAAPPSALLFPSPTGVPLSPDMLRKRVWNPALVKAGLRHVRIHSLRHSFASMLIQQGENPKYISAQMGHTSITITLDRYGHLFPNEKRTAATRLEAQLYPASIQQNQPQHHRTPRE